jgi:hypothetical protein
MTLREAAQAAVDALGFYETLEGETRLSFPVDRDGVSEPEQEAPFIALRAALAAPPSEEATGLDVERLTRALWNGLLPARHWLDNETTTDNFARWLAAEYARLTASDGDRE